MDEPKAMAADEQSTDASGRGWARLAIALALLAVVFAGAWLAWKNGFLPDVSNQEALRDYLRSAGGWAPLLAILLIAAAIILTPIPSAPIAVIAGALFGMVNGTAVVAAGSLLGACAAFWISRWAGYPILQRSPSVRQVLRSLERRRSQNALSVAVFVSRLIPFISFDAVSYAAGLTPLAFWRFVLATFAGVLPVSFLLVKLGNEAGSTSGIMPIILLVGMITAVPIAVAVLVGRRNANLPRSD